MKVGNSIPKNSTKNHFNYIIYGGAMQGTNLQKIVPFLTYFQLFCDLFSQKSKTGFMKENTSMQYNKYLSFTYFQKKGKQPSFGKRWVYVISIFHSPTAPSVWHGLSIHFS